MDSRVTFIQCSWSDCVTDWLIDWLMWVKIPTEYFTDVTLAVDDTYGGGDVVVDMEVDKVAGMVVKIPFEDFTDVTDWWYYK